MDAIETLLQDNSHPTAVKLLAFHRGNRAFLPLFVAELRLLRASGQRAGSADAIFNYLRRLRLPPTSVESQKRYFGTERDHCCLDPHRL